MPPSWESVGDGKLRECVCKTLFGVVIVNSASNSVEDVRFRRSMALSFRTQPVAIVGRFSPILRSLYWRIEG